MGLGQVARGTAQRPQQLPPCQVPNPNDSLKKSRRAFIWAVLESNVFSSLCVLVDDQVFCLRITKSHPNRCVPRPESGRLQSNGPINLIYYPSTFGNRSRLTFVGFHHYCDMSSSSLSSFKNPTAPRYCGSHW